MNFLPSSVFAMAADGAIEIVSLSSPALRRKLMAFAETIYSVRSNNARRNYKTLKRVFAENEEVSLRERAVCVISMTSNSY